MEFSRAGSGAVGGRRLHKQLGRTGHRADPKIWGMIWGAELADWGAPETPASEYEAVLERTLTRLDDRLRAAASERAEAPRLHELLIGRPPAQRRLLLDNLDLDRAFCLSARLIDRSSQDACQDLRQAMEHAELAIQVAERLNADHYGRCLIAEISARAWASFGNVCRLAGRLGRAEEAFRKARRLLEEGSGEPLEEALVFEQEAALRAVQNRWSVADDLLGVAALRFHEVRDVHLEGRAKVKLGVLELLRDRRQPALDALTEGLRRLEGDREPYVAVLGQALRAALLAAEPSLPAQVQAREALRRARCWLDRQRAEPLRSLVRRVETLVLEGVPALGPSVPPALARLVPVWPWRL